MFKKICIAFLLMGATLFAQEGVHWAKDYQTGLVKAQKEHKPVLFIISRDTCKYCVLLDNTTLSDPKVVAELNKNFIPIRSWINEHDYIPMELAQNTPGLPGIWFLDDAGTPLFAPLLGYVKTPMFLQALDIVKQEYAKQTQKEGK